MSNITTSIKRDYVLGQGISYFLLAALMASAVTQTPTDPGLNRPLFYIEKIGPLPVPVLNLHFDLAFWIMITFSMFAWVLSFYFLVSLFNRNWTFKAAKISEKLSLSMGMFFIMAFAISWLGTLPTLFARGNYLLSVIFAYSGFIMFIMLFIHWLMSVAKKDAKES